MSDNKGSVFDFKAFAERHGITGRTQTAQLAKMLGISAPHMRRILGGSRPSELMMIAAKALDRIVELENELRQKRVTQMRQGLDEIAGTADAGLTADEIMDETRERERT